VRPLPVRRRPWWRHALALGTPAGASAVRSHLAESRSRFAGAILDRIVHNADRLALAGQSLRDPKAVVRHRQASPLGSSAGEDLRLGVREPVRRDEDLISRACLSSTRSSVRRGFGYNRHSAAAAIKRKE
jgi:hypothetical protein